MRELLCFLKPYKKWVILAPAFMLVEVLSELVQPKLMRLIIDVGVVNRDVGYIIQIGLIMVLLAVFGITGGYLCLVFASKASQSFGADVRSAAFRKIQTFSFKNIDAFQPSSLITRLTNDITQMQMVVLMSLRMLVRAPLLSVGGILMAATINLKMTVVFLILVPVVSGVIAIILHKGFPLFQSMQEKLDNVNLVMRENLSGVRVVKAFVRSDFEKEKFQKTNEIYKNTTIQAFRVIVAMMPAMMLIMNLATIFILWFGGKQVQAGSMQVGDIMAFITYLTQILMALMMIAMVFMFISRAKVSADRLREILTAEVDIADPEKPVVLPELRGKVSFSHVSFRYAGSTGDPILENISFTAEPGQTIAILGETGAGKSSFVNLIPRLYDATEGSVSIDGVDVKNFRLFDLREAVSVVLQEAVLFSGTILENIKWGKQDASEEEVIAAAKAAQAHDFIMELPEKYETMLGQRGVNLSGGQKQRISIARALIKNPKILIFDDSTSAVDMVTEKKIQKALTESHKACTKFIIAQRVSSVMHADVIFVLGGGKIVAQGTHEELLQNSPDYQAIYDSQIKKGDVLHE